MNDWRPLSVREGWRQTGDLREDFSPQATRSPMRWLEGEFGWHTPGPVEEQLVLDIALIRDLDVDPMNYERPAMRQLLHHTARDDRVTSAPLRRWTRLVVT